VAQGRGKTVGKNGNGDGKRMPLQRLTGLKAARERQEREKREEQMKKVLPPMKPPVTWTTGVKVAAAPDGTAKYRAGLNHNPLPEVHPPLASIVPDGTFRDLVARGLSIAQISRELEISSNAVSRRLDKLNLRTEQQKAVEDYKRRKADIFATYQMDILGGITPEKIEAAGVDTLTRSFSLLYDRERLERGLSTENLDLHTAVAKASQIEELQARILERLGIKKGESPNAE
jgi:hypothetical protein